MLALRPFVVRCLRPLYRFRSLRESGRGAVIFRKFNLSASQRTQKPSLFEELFPEEVRKDGDQDTKFYDYAQEVPRLPLPEVDEFLDGFEHEAIRETSKPQRVTKAAVANAFRHEQVAVLSLEAGSKSLVESDFRRIAPKGQHIDHWTGPGDILKIIPVRDLTTFEPTGRYFVLFANPAYARTYQGHILRLHQMAKTYTPTSIESPLPLQPGVILGGEDAYTLLQDYSLCPPSQRIQIKLLHPSYTAGIKQVLEERGYHPLLEKTEKAGRSVLFSVDGQRWPTSMIRDAVAADGRDRGMEWDIAIHRLGTSGTEADRCDYSTTEELAQLSARQLALSRWVISFLNESEARRFIRVWHRRPFPLASGDDRALVQAEFIW